MKRLRELDSLRGLAALTVVFHHFLLVLPAIDLYTYGQESFWKVNLIKYTPLHLLWAGHEAVVFFFILSGFVLSLPFLLQYPHCCTLWPDRKNEENLALLPMPLDRGDSNAPMPNTSRSHRTGASGQAQAATPTSPYGPDGFAPGHKGGKYSHFLIKRVCRIYLPYLCAITIAIVLDLLLSRHGIPRLSGWFNATWTAKVSQVLVLNHYLFFGSFDNAQFDPVIWSLIQEMRISLFFPFLVYLAKRVDWKIMLGVSLLVYNYIGYDMNTIVTRQDPTNDMLLGGRYLLMFVIGILLAKHRFTLIGYFKKIPSFLHYGLLIIALLLYVNQWILLWIDIPYRDRLSDLLVCLGVCIILISALATVRLAKILHSRPLTYLGKISYSLYLFHAIVLLACINILYGRLPLAAILCIAFITTLVVSTLAYHLFERPSMALGKYLTRKRDFVSTMHVKKDVRTS